MTQIISSSQSNILLGSFSRIQVLSGHLRTLAGYILSKCYQSVAKHIHRL